MTMATLEKAILQELKAEAKNPKLKKKNIQEWSTSKNIKANMQKGEIFIYLPVLQIYVCYIL